MTDPADMAAIRAARMRVREAAATARFVRRNCRDMIDAADTAEQEARAELAALTAHLSDARDDDLPGDAA